jgi:cobalt-zinc-cadmium efflux system outer membrane protein
MRVLILLALATSAPAQDHISLKDLLAEARQSNPEILAAQKRYEAARQRPRQESSLPDPTLSLGYNSNGNPLPGAGLGTEPTSNIGFSVTQEFPAPGKLRLRGEISSKEADAEMEQYRAVERDVLFRLTEAYHKLHHSYAAMDVLDRNHALLQTLLRSIENRYAVGKGAQEEAFKTQTQLTILETQRVQVDRDRRAREAEINSLLNRASGTPVAEPTDVHQHEIAMTLDQVQSQARASAPELRRDQKMVERGELALNLARKDSYPDYALTGGYFNMGGMPAMYQFRADIKLPLQFGRRRAEVSEQWQSVAAARHEYTAASQSLSYRIEDAYLNAQTAYKLVTLYKETAIPQAHLALESSLIAYQNGKADFLSVFMNHIAVVEYEMNYHEQMLAYDLAVSQLEQLTGLSFEE